MSLRCWHCDCPLYQHADGHYSYETYTDPIGNKHMVHVNCLDKCEKPVTAAVSDGYDEWVGIKKIGGAE